MTAKLYIKKRNSDRGTLIKTGSSFLGEKVAEEFEFKLEFNQDDSEPSNEAVFIHMRRNVPIFQSKIPKEEYDILPSELKDPFLTGLFNISGVVELSSKAFRVWLMKSISYQWEEVLLPALFFIGRTVEGTQDIELKQLPGSAQPDGSGFTLPNIRNRRDL